MGEALRMRSTLPLGCWYLTSTHHASCTLPSLVFHCRSLTLIASCLRAQACCYRGSMLAACPDGGGGFARAVRHRAPVPDESPRREFSGSRAAIRRPPP